MGIYRVAPFAGALIQPDAFPVYARILAHSLPRLRAPLRDASARVGFDYEPRFAGATVGTHASAVRATAVPALGWELEWGLGSESRLGAPASVGVHGQPVVTDTYIGAHAHALGTTAVSALKRRREGNASARVWVHAEAQVAVAVVGTHAGTVRATSVSALVGSAGLRGQGHAVAVEVEAETQFAVADTWGHALGVRATSGTVWDTVVGGVEGEAWTAVADTWGDALAVSAPSGTLWDAFPSGVEGEALFAVADAWSHALAVRTPLGARWCAPAGQVEGEALFTGADAWRNAVATDASAGAAGHAGLCVTLGVGVPLATGAHSRGGALPVATVLADRYALLRLDVRAFRRGLKGEPSLAPADTWGDTVAVLAATRADGLAVAGQLVGVVAQFAGAFVWREAVRILRALVLAVGHADTFQRDPA